MLNGLKAEPRVAANVCWAFTGLSEAAYDAADAFNDDTPETYCLSKYFEFIIQSLLEATDRVDGSQANLRSGTCFINFYSFLHLIILFYIINSGIRSSYGND